MKNSSKDVGKQIRLKKEPFMASFSGLYDKDLLQNVGSTQLGDYKK